MQSRRAPRAAVFSAMAFFVMSCEPAGTIVEGGRADDYAVARQALETGNYPLAIVRYERLLDQAGDAAGRLNLEYAHSLLRAGRYEDAITVSSALIETQGGSLKGSALAVRGTAQHQIVRGRLDAGETEPGLRSRLLAAQADLKSFIKNHSNLDAAGAMKARLEMIAADLNSVS
ncbi:MAG: hypothetical protein AAFQ28_13835 [Pseudomonadota bacterium]